MNAELGLAALQRTPLMFEFEGLALVGFMGILAAAWLLGHFAHNYRAYAARLEERTAELERAREELARRAVTEERLRLAASCTMWSPMRERDRGPVGWPASPTAGRGRSARPWPPSRSPAGPP